MRLFLIRHGESVDNVAGVYAGSRDSPLTSHGVLQAQCTAARISKDAALHHIFSSDLRRAVKTAEAIVEEQRRVHQFDGGLVQLPSLREKDYGSLEGVRYDGSAGRRTADDSETRQSMNRRLGEFVDQHLVPLLEMETAQQPFTCAVVAHGTILGVFCSYLMARVKRSLVSEDATRVPDGDWHATAWWNAGITECTLSAPAAASTPSSCCSGPWGLCITRQNSTSHLRHLKKTRGGIGSAAYDDRQRTLTSFFSPAAKRKTEDSSADS